MSSPWSSTALPARPNVARRRSHGRDGSATTDAGTCVYPQTPKPPIRTDVNETNGGFGLTVRVEDVDGHVQPTVLLVSNPLRNEKPLPPSPLQNIPLTPQVESLHEFTDSNPNGNSPRLDVERFPTPDFSSLKRNPLHQALIAPLNYFRSRAPTPAQDVGMSSDSKSIKSSVSTKATAKSQLRRAHSDASSIISGSVVSHESNVSFHPLVVHNERFTRKFPIPPSFSRTSSLVSASRSSLPPTFPGLIPPLAEIDDTDGGRWTKYKFVLLFSVVLVFVAGLASLVCAILVWFRTWDKADVMWVADNDVLVFITLSATLLLLTSLIGTTGTLLNSRPILTFYAVLLWPSLISILIVGYTSYRRATFALDRKLNLAWSEWYDDAARMLIQNSLSCCGYYNALHQATFTKRCYPRTTLPGCKGKLFRFEHENLTRCYTVALLVLTPLQIAHIFVAMLCSNHVNRTFGKGLTPRQYRLNMADVQANARSIIEHFEQMGTVSEDQGAVDSDSTPLLGSEATPRGRYKGLSRLARVAGAGH